MNCQCGKLLSFWSARKKKSYCSDECYQTDFNNQRIQRRINMMKSKSSKKHSTKSEKSEKSEKSTKHSKKISPKVVEIFSKVISTIDCPLCKSKRGHRCVNVSGEFIITGGEKIKMKKGEKRNRPHRQRISIGTKKGKVVLKGKVHTMKKKSA